MLDGEDGAELGVGSLSQVTLLSKFQTGLRIGVGPWVFWKMIPVM